MTTCNHFIGLSYGRLAGRKAYHLFKGYSACGEVDPPTGLEVLTEDTVDEFLRTHAVCERCLIRVITGQHAGHTNKAQHELWRQWRPFFKLG